MLLVGICDDEKGTCTQLENRLYEYGKRHGIRMEVNTWYSGETLCEFLKNDSTLDMLFLDIGLITTDGIKVGSFIREELENMETAIVYISSSNNYAMRLFRIQPLDFLIKPIGSEQIEDVIRNISSRENS